MEGAERMNGSTHTERRRLLIRGRRRYQFGRAVLVGLLAGLFALAFQLGLYYTELLRGMLRLWLKGYPLIGWVAFPLIAATAGGFVVWWTTRFAPEASGSGIPNVKEALLLQKPVSARRILPVKFFGGLLAIGAGFSLGREGPTVQMGAAAGNIINNLFGRSPYERRHLIACGAGAGLSAAFNAPLAGFVFVIEELQREMSPLTYGTAFIAAVTADVVARFATGQLPSFHISSFPIPPLRALPLFILLGIAAGLVGVAFNKSLLKALKLATLLGKHPPWLRGATTGLVVGMTVWLLPQVVGGGHSTADYILKGGYVGGGIIGLLLLLLTAKFLLTVISYASGAPGGVFAPMLLIGAILGLIVGQAAGGWFPELVKHPAAFAVVGMGALFVAVTRAPLTGIALILEMTASHQMLFPLLVACLLAYLVVEQAGAKPLYDALLQFDWERRGYPATDEHSVVFEVTVEPESQMANRLVRRLHLPPGILLVMVQRGARELVPTGDTLLEPGDRLTVVVSGDVDKGAVEVRRMAAGG